MFEPWVFAAKGQERPHGTPAEVFEAEEEAAAAAHRSSLVRDSLVDAEHATRRDTIVSAVTKSHLATGKWQADSKDKKAQHIKAVWGMLFMKNRKTQTK